MQNKIKLFSVISLFAILILSGCSTNSNTETRIHPMTELNIEKLDKNVVDPTDFCNAITGFSGLAGGKESCLTSLAKFKQDESICEQIPKSDKPVKYKSNCYIGVAIAKKDLSICETQDIENKDNCINSVKKSLAISEIDDKYCDEIIDIYSLKDFCYLEVSRLSPSMDICNKISNEGNKAWCLGDVAGKEKDISICEDIADSVGSNKARCFIKLAKSTQDTSYCDSLDKNLKPTCISVVAVEKNDVTLCNQITSEPIKNGCLSEISMINSDLELCKQSGSSKCITEIASSLKDDSVCENLKDSQKLDCYDKVAEVTRDPDICTKVGNKGSRARDICLREVARTVLNPKLCEEVSNSWFKEWCYTNLVNNYYDYEREESIMDNPY